MNGSSCLLIEQRDHGQVKSRRKSRKRLKSCRIILWLQVLLGMAYPILCTRYTLRHQNPKITSFTVGSQTTKAIKWLETRLSISQEEGFTYTSQDKQSSLTELFCRKISSCSRVILLAEVSIGNTKKQYFLIVFTQKYFLSLISFCDLVVMLAYFCLLRWNRKRTPLTTTSPPWVLLLKWIHYRS